MAEVLSHPTFKFRELLLEAKGGGIERVIEAFKFAVENGIPRTPILKLLEELPDAPSRLCEPEIEPFVRWCASKRFVAAEPGGGVTSNLEAEEPSPNIVDELYGSEQRRQLFAEVREMGRAVEEKRDELVGHRYWYFRPGYEIDGARWNQMFGDADPVLTVVSYLRSFFKTPPEHIDHQNIKLNDADKTIIKEILRSLSHASRERIDGNVGALLTAAGLETLMEGALSWASDEFTDILTLSPKWLRELLIQYWATRADFSVMDDDDDDDDEEEEEEDIDDDIKTIRENIKEQVTIVTTALMSYCGEKIRGPLKGKVDVDFLSDETICMILSTLDIFKSTGWCSDFVEEQARNATSALYEARASVLGGVFPFPFEEAHQILCNLPNRAEYWLSTIVHYVPEHYDEEIDEFSLLPALRYNHGKAGNVRTNPRATWRYRAYRKVYEICVKDGLEEFATAWWAFFVASQAYGFAGLGVSSNDLAEVSAICASRLDSPSMLKAVRFVVETEGAREPSLASRVCLSRFEPLLVEQGVRSPVDRLEISVEQSEAWLKKTIGQNTWDALDPQSREDLIFAEQVHYGYSPELGRGRRDWGNHLGAYARVLDREVRKLVGPLVRRLEKAGFFDDQAEDLNYGNCIARIRTAKKIVRRGRSLPEGDETYFEKVVEFDKANSYVVTYRDNAVHAGNPISPAEYIKWRICFSDKKILDVLLDK